MSMDAPWYTTHEAPEISLEHVSLGYDNLKVLSDINAVLPRNKISVILGGSGGGKSTLLKTILGLLPPTQGRILLGGVDIYDITTPTLREMRKRMGVLFQDGALLGSLPLGENIALPLREHTNQDEDIIETVVSMKLSLVGLDKFMDFFPSQLSGGMRKRAGLARSLVMDPKILLCEEPTSGLDPITAADLDRLILDLKDAFGMTIVVVSHDLQSLYTIADNVVVLNKGARIFEGGLEELGASQDPFLKQFLSRQPNHKNSYT